MSQKLLVVGLSFIMFSGCFVQLLNSGEESISQLSSEYSGLTSFESGMLGRLNSSKAWMYGKELERIALDKHAFRSAGSSGANDTAIWVSTKFSEVGLETWNESFEFTTWDLLSDPRLVVYVSDHNTTDNDQFNLQSFQSEHYSWPTKDGMFSAEAVILPLPYVSNRGAIGSIQIDDVVWDGLRTKDKIVFVGREVRWDRDWERDFLQKMTADTPAAVVFVWWYDWMERIPPAFYPSAGGRPIGSIANRYWNLGIPTGSINFTESLWIRNTRIGANLSASISINSTIASGNHVNVVGKIEGSTAPEKLILISGHYDTVMDPGFCDNGAGIAAMMEIARAAATAVNEGLYRPKYTLLFVAFAAEELGMVGSINFISKHMAIMSDIVAVLNLDCIGSDQLRVSMTDSADSLDLDQLVLEAARDLGENASLEGVGGSDQEPFRDPSGAGEMYYRNWGKSVDISEAEPIAASTMLSSSPISYSDIWTTGVSGWIHTSYDTSYIPNGLDWIDQEDFGKHMKVAALSVLRLSTDVDESQPINPLLSFIPLGIAFLLALVISLILIRRKT